MTDEEKELYLKIVDDLRKQGWDRTIAEEEALDRIDRMRQREKQEGKS